MARKKTSRKGQDQPLVPSNPDPFLLDPRIPEHAQRAILNHIEAMGFASIDDANDYLNELSDSGMLDKIIAAQPTNPRDRAMNIVYDAWDAPSAVRRRKLAKEALELDPDCADAWSILADTSTRDPDQAESYFRQALEAATRTLGPEQFAEYEGELWSSMDGRPYMRAMHGLVELLWHQEKYEESLDLGLEMLRLNAPDNQGCRYIMVPRLIATGLDDEARQLLDRYRGDYSADWEYSRALLEYRKKPNSRAANRARQQALHFNPFAALYLTGMLPLPTTLPPFVEAHRSSEGVQYAFNALDAWINTPGALDWLGENLDDLVHMMLQDDPGDADF